MRSRTLRYAQERKQKKTNSPSLGGGSHFFFLSAAALLFVLGGMYLFAVNERAVYGYDIRTIEKELVSLKKANAELRLREAEGRSLRQVETGSLNLRMEKAIPSQELMIKKPGSVAYH